jgi:hypothetical protein
MQTRPLTLDKLAKMARRGPVWVCLLSFFIPAAHGQFLGIGFGRQLSQTLERGATPGTVGSSARSHFGDGGVFALDAGMRVFPFVNAGLHYSSSNTDLSIERGDAFGSSAEAELSTHTVTMDFRARTPSVRGFRLFGLAGAGLTRFGLDIKQEVENPFPGGTPNTITSFVFTYGGGVERHLHQFVHLRLEVRDYVTPISEHLFRPEDTLHRVAAVGGITLGL